VDEPKAICARCGVKWAVNRPKAGRTDLLCRSCRATKQKVIDTGGLRCVPWQGDYSKEDLVSPMLNGNLYLPGHRVCGKRDCINPAHIN
jgi:hypothetical protein